MIDLRLLQQFIAVAEELHFHRAARRLNMAQPPLSQAIRRLENELGTRLFERSSRLVKLTPAGTALLEAAQRTVTTLADGIAQTRRVAAGLQGQLAVSFLDMSLADRLPGILRRFRAAYPDVALRLQEGTTAEQVEAILTGSADVGFMRRPGVAVGNLAVERVAREPVRVALPRQHPLSRRATVRLADLATTPFVATPREKGAGFHDQILGLCRAAGFSPVVVQQARQMQTVVSLVAAGFGAALVPGSVAAARRPGVVFRPVRVDAPEEMRYLDLMMAWDSRRSSAVRDRFVETVRKMKLS